MKKVFVSIPLKGRSKEEIQKSLDKIEEAVKGLLDKDVEILHQDFENLIDFDKGEEGFEDNLEFLAKDIELMAQADYFATISENWDFRHCSLEEDIFRRYISPKWEEKENRLMRFSLNIIAPDIVKKEKEEAEKIFKMEFKAYGSTRDNVEEIDEFYEERAKWAGVTGI